MAKNKIEELLGEDENLKAGQNPETATPDREENENPLEKMDEISKAKPQKNKNDSKDLDEDTVLEMFKTGENTDGMFTPKEEDEHEDEDEKAKVKLGNKVEPSKKYADKFKNDMLKHPDEYKIMTPRGEMTVAEAIRSGYNPMTKSFEKNHDQNEIKKKYLDTLNDTDRAALEQFTNPANAQVAPADAEQYGLNPGSPMIRPQESNNPMMQAAPVLPTANGIGAQLPGEQESTAPGAADLSALLGGQQ